MKIGIDLGNVIIGGDNEWFSGGDSYLRTPGVVGASESMDKLYDLGQELFVVSKAFPRNQIKSVRWLREHDYTDFFDQLNTFFVLRREDKALVCDSLGLDLMIDDRSDIIDHINLSSKGTIGYLFEGWAKFWEDYDELRRTL
jgi:hypothetical protein